MVKFINALIFQLFKGKFYHCDNYPSVKTKQECYKEMNKTDNVEWTNRPYNFDNLGQVTITMSTILI